MTNGYVTQHLKMEHEQSRSTAIKRGRETPTLAQFPKSDPRPYLSLCRGPDESDANDVLLGHFEVLDVPDDDRNNISTICVIVDNKIFLAARDNHRDEFLAIRKIEQVPNAAAPE